MRYSKRSKTITIAILTIAIIGLSIGFAAYSSTLKISSRANINPNGGFSVIFASSVSTSDQGLSYQTNTSQYPVSKNITGSATAGNPTIDNSGTYPTIEDLEVTFTNPGESITYTFYVVNTGAYDAFLTNLIFNNAQGANSFKHCEADASSDMPGTNANSVCNNINFTVKIGNESAVSNTTTLNNHLLYKNTYEEVVVTISYTGEVYADGAITIDLGDVELHYSTIDEPVAVATEDAAKFYYAYVYDAPVTYATTDNCESAVLLMDSEMDLETAAYACNNPLDEVIYNMSQGYISSADEPYYTSIILQLVGYGALEQQSEGNIIGVGIVGVDNLTSTIDIPATINNLPVIKIFALIFDDAHTLSEVHIPYTVEEIQASAFHSNPLQTVIIGDATNGSNLTNVGDYAFYPDEDEHKDPYPDISNVTIYASTSDVTLGSYAFGENPTITWLPVGQ